MSRVFDALRKSEEEAGKHSFDSAETFFISIEEKQGLLPVATEYIHVRPENRIVAHTHPQSAGGERFRFLRAYLRDLQAGGKLKVLLLTSALPSEGKSTIAVNLATVLAKQGSHRVLLLEADLRRPSLTRQWGVKPWEGVAEILRRNSDPVSCIRLVQPLGIYVLPAGVDTAEPTEVIPREGYAELIGRLAPHFDWIVVDSPPAIAIADALELKQMADAVLLIVRAGYAPREAVEEAMDEFANGKVIGIILNCMEGVDALYGGYYRPRMPTIPAPSRY